jgi:hypothetical protein
MCACERLVKSVESESPLQSYFFSQFPDEQLENKHPDPEWSSHVKELQDQNMERVQAGQESSFQVVHRGTVKRSRISFTWLDHSGSGCLKKREFLLDPPNSPRIISG